MSRLLLAQQSLRLRHCFPNKNLLRGNRKQTSQLNHSCERNPPFFPSPHKITPHQQNQRHLRTTPRLPKLFPRGLSQCLFVDELEALESQESQSLEAKNTDSEAKRRSARGKEDSKEVESTQRGKRLPQRHPRKIKNTKQGRSTPKGVC